MFAHKCMFTQNTKNIHKWESIPMHFEKLGGKKSWVFFFFRKIFLAKLCL